MKTAEEWLDDLDADNLAEENSKRISARQLRIVQLDAMKEGMRRAAIHIVNVEVAKLATGNLASEAIFTAAEQLTEKDL